MERVIQCPVCFDTDNCFEESQPTYNSYLCFHCGFMSDSRYSMDKKELKEEIVKFMEIIGKDEVEEIFKKCVFD